MDLTSFDNFKTLLKIAQENYPLIEEATTPYQDLIVDDNTRYYVQVHTYGWKGYAISDTGELTSLYSTYKGQGEELVLDAILNGATNLDCFDGYLTDFYSKLGFVEVFRQENWTEGGPDVVFMRLITNALNRVCE